MPTAEKMKDQLVAWGLLSQVWELKDAGFALDVAIYLVYTAHINKAYTAAQITA